MFFGDFFVLYTQSECEQVSACFYKPRLFVSNGRMMQAVACSDMHLVRDIHFVSDMSYGRDIHLR